MDNPKKLLTFLIINIVSLWGAAILFPQHVVLGNSFLPFLLAGGLSSVLLTGFSLLAESLMKGILKSENVSGPLGVYGWLSQSIGVWLIARGASVTGLGISSYVVAILLGLTLTFLQRRAKPIFRE